MIENILKYWKIGLKKIVFHNESSILDLKTQYLSIKRYR